MSQIHYELLALRSSSHDCCLIFCNALVILWIMSDTDQDVSSIASADDGALVFQSDDEEKVAQDSPQTPPPILVVPEPEEPAK